MIILSKKWALIGGNVTTTSHPPDSGIHGKTRSMEIVLIKEMEWLELKVNSRGWEKSKLFVRFTEKWS